MLQNEYTILKVYGSLKSAESFIAKHYANDNRVVVEQLGDSFMV